jgi:hypothetical protein
MMSLALLIFACSSHKAQSQPDSPWSVVRSNSALYSYESPGHTIVKTPIASLTDGSVHKGSVVWTSAEFDVLSCMFLESQLHILVRDTSRELYLASLPQDGRSAVNYLKLKEPPRHAVPDAIKSAQLLRASGRTIVRFRDQPGASPESSALSYWEIDRVSGQLDPIRDEAGIGDTPIATYGNHSFATTSFTKEERTNFLRIGPIVLTQGRFLTQVVDRVVPEVELDPYRPFGIIEATGTPYTLASYQNRDTVLIVEVNSRSEARLIGSLSGLGMIDGAAYQWTPSIAQIGPDRYCIASDGAFLAVRLKSQSL